MPDQQCHATMSNEDVQAKCVEPAEGIPISSSLQTAFDTLKEQSFSVSWVSPNSCLQLEKKEKNILFVVDPFDGAAFHHLATLGCRVVGPQCVLSTLLMKISVPRRRQPIYNLAMKDLIISCSSVEKEAREVIYKRVEMMGGATSKDLTDAVTHLVVGEVGSKKYHVAASNGKGVMTPEWVDAVWEKSQYRHVHGADEAFQKYKCPIFRGVSVTVSGLNTAERRDIKDAVEGGGGRYSGEMKMKECTHLILYEPKGQKYDFAKKWQIHRVTPNWVSESIKKGFCLSECDYHLKGGSGQNVQTSTPEKDTTTGREFGDISAISVASMSNMVATVNETAATGQTTFRASIDPDVSGVKMRSCLPNPEEDPDVSSLIPDLLDGLRIYISGFRGDELERLRKMINASGGTRYSTLNESVTHVLQGEPVTRDLDLLSSGLIHPHVVSPTWLLECLRQGRVLKESQFLCKPAISTSTSTSTSTPTPANQSVRKSDSPPSEVTLRPCQDEVDGGPGKEKEEQEILQQYLPQEEEENPADVTGGIFQGKTFKLFGFDEEQQTELAEYLSDQGGAAIRSDDKGTVADFGIVPITGFPVPGGVRQVLTNAWLQICIEEEALLPVHSNRLFHPLVLENSSQPLAGCVVSISGYTGTERDCLIHIAELLGSNCQEFFVRKRKRELEANTHLVCKLAEGSKFQAAKKWGLPAVTKEWLFACVDADRKVQEEDYLVDRAEETAIPADPTLEAVSRQTSATADRDGTLPAAADKDGTLAAAADLSAGNDDKASDGVKPTGHNSLSPASVAQPNDRNSSKAFGRTSCATEDGAVEKSVAKANTSVDSSGVISFGNNRSVDSNVVSLKSADRGTDLKEQSPHVKGDRGDQQRSSSGFVSDRTVSSETVQGPGTPAGAVPSSSTENTPGERRGEWNPMSGALTSAEKRQRLGESQKENRQQLQTTPMVPGKLQHSRVKELQDSFGQKSPRVAGSPHYIGVETPGKFLAEGKKYQPVYNLKNAMADLASPVVTENQRRSSLPLDEVFSEAVAVGVHSSAIHRKPANPSTDSQGSNSQEELGPLHGVVIAVSKKLASKQAEYNEIVRELGGGYVWSYNSTCTHLIFQGRANDMSKEFRVARSQGKTIVCPQWLLMCKESSARVDESLFPHNYNPHLTLSCVTPGRARRSARNASDPNQGSQRKAPESARKNRQNPETVSMKEPSKESKSLEKEQRVTSPEPTAASSPSRAAPTSSEKEADGPPQLQMEVDLDSGGTLEMREALNRGVETLMANSAKVQKQNRRKNRRLDSSGTTSSGSPDNRRHSRPERKSRERVEKLDNGSLPESSQMVQVSWDDPIQRMEQERMAEKLQKAFCPSQSSQNTDQFLAGLDIPEHENTHTTPVKNSARSCTPDPPSLRFPHPPKGEVLSPQPVTLLEEESSESRPTESAPPPPIFIVSSMQPNERIDYGALVETLGGQLLDKQFFDPVCTHLVVGVPGRNEKFLAAVASGRWVLHKSYFEACRKEGCFVKEEPHEWGGEGTRSLENRMSPSTLKLVAAAHRWRQDIMAEKKTNPKFGGAFDGWKVLLVTDKGKEGSFLRLLEAGGAHVIPYRSPIPKNIDATHAFVDLEKRQIPESDLATLLQADVHCLKPDFIASHLMENPLPSPPDFYPPQITSLLVSLSESSLRKRKHPSSSSGTSKRSKRH